MTPTAITVGNVASVSGPVPGIFQGAPYGVDAFFAYINSQGGVNGRKLQRKFGDDGFNCNSAPVFQKNPNVADLAYVLDTDLENLSNNFSVSPQPPGWRTGPYIYYKEKYPDHLNVGSLYSNSAGGTFSWHGMRAAAESVGYKMVYERAVGPTETDFTSDVLRMRAAGVNFLATSGLDPNSIARLVNTVRQQKWDPLIEAGGSIYAVDYLKLFNPGAGDGVLQDQAFAMFLGEDAADTPEVGLFDTWMKKHPPKFPARPLAPDPPLPVFLIVPGDNQESCQCALNSSRNASGSNRTVSTRGTVRRRRRCDEAAPSPGGGNGRCSRWGSAPSSPGARARPPRTARPAPPR